MKSNDQHLSLLADEQPSYRVYPYRFVIITCFLLLAFSVQAATSSTVPIILLLSGAYDMPVWVVNSLPLITGTFLSILGMLLSNHYFDYVGIKTGVRIGAAILLVALWTMVFSNYSFWFIFAGQNILRFVTPCFANTTQTISSIWFGPEERLKATTFLNIFIIIGTGFGALVPGWFIGKDLSDKEIISEVCWMNVVVAIIVTILAIPAVIFIRSKPPTPPCGAVTIERLNLYDSLVQLVKNKNSLMFLISAGTRFALPGTLQSAIQVIIAPFGFTAKDVAYVFIWANIFTLPFFYLAIFVFTKFQSYKKTFNFFNILLGVFVIGLIPILMTRSGWLIGCYLILLIGIASCPLGIGLEFIAEISFPVGETAAGGLLILIVTQINSMTTFMTDSIIYNEERGESYFACLILGIMSLVGIILNFYVKEDLRRTNFFMKKEEVEEIQEENNKVILDV